MRGGLIPLQLAHNALVHESPTVRMEGTQSKATLAALLFQGEQNAATSLRQQWVISKTQQTKKDAGDAELKPFAHSLKTLTLSCFASNAAPPLFKPSWTRSSRAHKPA